MLPPDKATEPAALGRFFREARAAGMLDHPNVVRFHDLNQDRGLHFLVMEYVHGLSFGELVRRHGLVDLARFFPSLPPEPPAPVPAEPPAPAWVNAPLALPQPTASWKVYLLLSLGAALVGMLAMLGYLAIR